MTVNLFSYGTLQETKVQQAVFDGPITGEPDAIVGYRLETFTITGSAAIAISGHANHTMLEPTGDDADEIEGTRSTLSDAQLAMADAYEDAAYKRVEVALRSGVRAWAYVRA
ncbi:MAG TPA: gamma-glutamylcyclotransferase family protein [Rhizomicrobium sp.]|jgi:hypothetical protein